MCVSQSFHTNRAAFYLTDCVTVCLISLLPLGRANVLVYWCCVNRIKIYGGAHQHVFCGPHNRYTNTYKLLPFVTAKDLPEMPCTCGVQRAGQRSDSLSLSVCYLLVYHTCPCQPAAAPCTPLHPPHPLLLAAS